jgi:hypothetical protein
MRQRFTTTITAPPNQLLVVDAEQSRKRQQQGSNETPTRNDDLVDVGGRLSSR